MREIKFRGKAKMSIEKLNELGLKHENGWVYGHLVMYGKTPYIVGDFIEVDSEYTVNEFWVEVIPDTVGQFVGLKDKNGKEIYEGDIVRGKYGKNGIVKNYEIRWLIGHFAAVDRNNITCDEHYYPIGLLEGEVIGNIYENKHLL